MALLGIALALAAAIGGVVVGAWSLRVVVVLQVLCVLVALRVREPRVHGPLELNVLVHLGSALRGLRRNPVLRRMTLVSALHYSSESAAQLSPVFVARLWPLWALGLWRTFGQDGCIATPSSDNQIRAVSKFLEEPGCAGES
ncbi:hypothetical protein ACIBQ1_37035 [Nonomuraea sp. NPDC050153]|uniref:hypothetical protein n=1 Tax=Nonomuraea sp. NPDC050153 TaxID=3364359 RepID=UPI0037958524